jgi:type IV pilus assembly protein PilP
MKTQIDIRHLAFGLSFLLLLVTAPLSLQAMPETIEGTGPNPTSEQLLTELPATAGDPAAVFTYQLEGRPDPFSPFISEKATSNINMDEIVDTGEALTGMQLFEPGQLTLVAIIFEDKAELAMVEDAAGQGYTLRPGMKIGKKGIITTIDPNQVNIEETSVTRAGKQLTNKIVMLLKKEGEE